MPSNGMTRKAITLDNMNPNVKLIHHSIRSPIITRAQEIERELEKGIKRPFTEVIMAHLADGQAMGQRPLTFFRQVLTLCSYPTLLKEETIPADVRDRVEVILNECGGRSVGAYSDSVGVEIIRRHVAEHIERRDGFPSRYEDIMLDTGASEAIRSVLNILNYPTNGKRTGVMIPIPQYPFYSSTLAEFGMYQINYYLDEDNEWSVNINELRTSVTQARSHCDPRACVIINPGNPTGSVLTRQNIEEIIKFAFEERLFIMADEVYQDNIYGEGVQFHSFKKVMMEMGPPYCHMEMASFMSASKGYMGECGLRGGYCELINLHPDVKKVYLKSICVKMCPSVIGQAAVDCVVNPLKPGDPSYDLFIQEKTDVLHDLKEKAEIITSAFSNIQGMKCSKIYGAMYAFPRIFLPEKAIEKAKSLGQSPDYFYAMQLLESAGVCVIPGSSFGQHSGTYHFRSTILPPVDKLKIMLSRIRDFHQKFMEEYK